MANAPGDIVKLLETLHDSPVDTNGASEAVLAQVHGYLMHVPASKDGLHWFCSLADPTTIAAATFLLRLHAYSSPEVAKWKERLSVCLESCLACIQGLEEAKFTSRSTYFAAFPEATQTAFFNNFEEWELSVVLEALKQLGINDVSDLGNKKLSDFPSPLVYRMVSNWTIFRNPQVLAMIRACPPTEPFLDWPSDPLPAGLFLLLLDTQADVRHWAKSQAMRCQAVPIDSTKFVGSYRLAYEVICNTLASAGGDQLIPHTLNAFSLSTNPMDIWSGISSALRLIPVDILIPKAKQPIDIRRVVIGHLHDTGPHFPDVLRCLLFLLKRIGEQLWVGEGSEYPQVVFDSVKDNSSFLQMIQDFNCSADRPWFLSWLFEYLHTIRSLPVYGEVLAKIADFLCEELQHERFRDVRPIIMNVASRLLAAVLRKCKTEDGFLHRKELFSVLDIHTDILVKVAFSRQYNDEKWSGARASARELIMAAFLMDVKDIAETISKLCKNLANVLGRDGTNMTPVSLLSVRKLMWGKAYASLQPNDVEGIAALLAIVAQSSHLDNLNKKPFTPLLQTDQGKEYASGASVIDDINASLRVVWEGFLDALSNVASPDNLIAHTNVAKDITIIMLSPVETLQSAAQSIVGLAYDVDARIDCFRALLQYHPDAAFSGVFEFLETFIKYAPVVPEACNLSKSLVRCFTDIIQALCSSPDGLLLSSTFLKPSDQKGPASLLPKLWNLMTTAIKVIFKRTPLWSTYFNNEEMIVWMRDALIFGRDLLAQWRTIETAAMTIQQSALQVSRKSRGLSNIGRRMVNDLQDFLPELARWMRLTDEELLHQSFSLLQSLLDCFSETGVQPSKEGVAKLNRHIATSRDDTQPHARTRLDAARLSQLEAALASFDEDEVQIVAVKAAPEKERDKEEVKEIKEIKEETGKPTKFRLELPSQRKESKQTDLSKWVKKEIPKPSTTPVAPIATSSKAIKSHFFTARDQEVLDAAPANVPKFVRSSTNAPAPLGKPPPPQTTKKPTLLKNEAKQQSSSVPASEAASSSDESETDDDAQQSGLAALAKMQRSPTIRKPQERRQIKTIEIPAATKAYADRFAQRDIARRNALRLKPDVSGLHKVLLSWDYEHTGSEPPGEKLRRIHVPDRFNNYDHYRSVFEPLLLLECWSQIVQAKEESQDFYDVQILSRQYSDDWVLLEISFIGPVTRDFMLTETDVVLLRHPASQKSVMAKAMHFQSNPRSISAGLRCYFKQGAVDPGLSVQSSWKLCKVFSLSTLHREYAALVSMQYYDFHDTILQARLPSRQKPNPQEIQKAMTAYKVNEPQAAAIAGAMKTDGFVLIQGPPGTGKTSTICGLVASFLEKRQKPAVAIHVGRQAPQAASDKPPVPKVLLCAPSNAAIDEIAYRLKEGYRGSQRRAGSINVVRVGADKAVNSSVKDITLDFLVDQKLDTTSKDGSDVGLQIKALREELDLVKEKRQQLIEEEAALQGDSSSRAHSLQQEIREATTRRRDLTSKLTQLKDKQTSESRTVDANRRRLRNEILQEADVVCSTLSAAGHEMLEALEFDMVIIDEAAQAIELSSLIPLRYRCTRCIMVGDPQQLPPTVLSQEACRYEYNQSLFVRLQKQRPEAVYLLSIQYRMHPDISRFPSQVFYDGRLQDGPNMAAKTLQPWHRHEKFGTYRFFNVVKGQEEQAGRSIKNSAECQAAISLYTRLFKEYSSIDLDSRIGVISMYRAQIGELRKAFEQRFGRDILGKIHFNTVDGFQGQEKDIIILSCVRAGPGVRSVGFLSDTRRMNVALTRAKSSLFILGNAPTLERSDDVWRKIVGDARSRGSMFDIDHTFFTTPNSAPQKAPPTIQKAHRPQPATTTAIPMDLVTPQELATQVNISQPPLGPSAASYFSHPELKRSAEDSEEPPRPQGYTARPNGPRYQNNINHSRNWHENANDTNRPRPRPPKRKEKSAADSMFIPKKKQRP
ncbi:hypothetical protein AX16_007996 [Volvariella volvacea WC 439]|nr:hypothetical protein AX16_007996 [Volvariella volvacea WC 439]